MKKKINVFKLVQSLPNDVHIVYPVNGYLSIKKKKKKKGFKRKNNKKKGFFFRKGFFFTQS